MLTRTQLVLLPMTNVQGAMLCLPRSWAPSERGAEYKSIKYVRSSTVVMHDCAPKPRLSLLLARTPHGPPQLPRWQPGLQPTLQPSLQLESPFQWPLLGMCSSSKSNAHARKSGTQCRSLSRDEYALQQAVSLSFCGSYALVFACLALCHRSVVFTGGGGHFG